MACVVRACGVLGLGSGGSRSGGCCPLLPFLPLLHPSSCLGRRTGGLHRKKRWGVKKETRVRGAGHRRGRRDGEDEPGESHTVLFCLNVPIHVPDTELLLSQPPSDLGTRPDSGYIWVGP